ncbi:lysine-specific demethylase 3A-like isoform X2 [Babylonia areolata]|uniref:lysine-specific demethylase 3A-like isoform X2 n=1 Tax=Babylonia areolata TaxID=304850 RepID=UPI003FCFC367
MSQDKRCTVPATPGKSENIFNLYGYHPQFSANTHLPKEGLSSQEEKNAYVGQGGTIYFPRPSKEAVHASSQQGQSSVLVHNVVKTESVVVPAFISGSLTSSSSMPHAHTHPAQTRQQHSTSVPASGLVVGQSVRPVGSGFSHSISNISTAFPGSAPDSQSATYLPASVPMSEAARGAEDQSGSLNSTSKFWQTEQLRAYYSPPVNKADMPASGSVPANSHIIIQQGSGQRQATVSVSLPTVSHSLIQQGLLANPLYSQGSVSSVGQVLHTQAQPQTKSATTPSPNPPQTLAQVGRVMPSSSQMQPSQPAHSYYEGGKRKSNNVDNLECGSKYSRTASKTVWDMGRSSSDVSVPLTTTKIAGQLAPHTSSNTNGGGWSSVGTTANTASGFIDTFRSFVESTSHGAYSQQNSNKDLHAKPVVYGNPGSTLCDKEDLMKRNLSQNKVVSSSEESYLGEEQSEKLKRDPPQPQSQSFVEKMHATIFSLSEEVSSSGGTGVGGQQPSMTMSSSSLASILKKVGRSDGSQDTNTDRQMQNVPSLTGKAVECPSNSATDFPSDGQKTLSVSHSEDNKKSSPSPTMQPCRADCKGAVKSEFSEEIKSISATVTGSDHHRPNVSSSSIASSLQPGTKLSDADGSVSSASDSEPESKPVPLSSSNPCVQGNRKKQTSATKESGSKASVLDKPLVKVSLATLKRTGAPFLQNGPCSDLSAKVSKCRECRQACIQGNTDMPSIFCRFYAFRRLKYNPVKGTVLNAGFSELSDADPDHIEPWLPRFPIEDPQLSKVMAKFIVSKVGDKFCELVQQEKEVKAVPGTDATVVWKRAVTGVREMCDVCETTIFNMHWVCSKCGYVVCLDCYKAKTKVSEEDGKQVGEGSRKWQICTSSRYPHDPSKLMLTQIIPSDALWELGRMIHDIRRKWSIPGTCPCGQNSSDSRSDSKTDQSSARMVLNGLGEEGSAGKSRTSQAKQKVKGDPEVPGGESGTSKGPHVDSGVKKEDGGGVVVKQDGGPGGSQKLGGCTSLRELLTKTAGKGRVGLEKKAKPKVTGSSLNDIIQSVVEKSCRDLDSPSHTFKFLHYIPRLGQWTRELPIVAHSLTETSVLYPDVPHSWLCDGRLLRLHDPHHKGNLKIFQEQWKRGQPVMVSAVHKLVTEEDWKPQVFSRQFGHRKNDLVNCHNGDIISDHPMRDFWDGFESIENRLVDETGQDLMLKLKDWPPGDDFAELLPSHFNSLMEALPLPEYTRRDGALNLASRLPDFLVRPDLGPKMYNAFGSAKYPKEGTTNLHLDISDAVNVLVYVGVPSDGPRGKKEHENAAVKAIDEAGCDSITKRRVREVHELPGALWQIYDAHDADKMRDFLNKVAKERGEEIEQNHDAIHDQSWYLDEELRDRLLKEYGVQGYTIVQCLGDSIFIPAGAPHQVRNLHSCIKVAEDFVSPEHLNHCFRLTQEFRQLSETHSNHEDKLQVKNITYHAVKDSIAVLRELEPEDDD